MDRIYFSFYRCPFSVRMDKFFRVPASDGRDAVELPAPGAVDSLPGIRMLSFRRMDAAERIVHPGKGNCAEQPPGYDFPIGALQQTDSMPVQFDPHFPGFPDRRKEDVGEHFRAVIRGDPVDGYTAAFYALMDDHQFAIETPAVLLADSLQGQSDRLHRTFAGGEPIAGGKPIHMPGPQAERAMIPVADARP